MSNVRGGGRRCVASPWRVLVAVAVASALLAGCSTPEDDDGTAAVDRRADADSIDPADDPSPGDSSGPTRSSSTDMCEVVRPGDLAMVLEAAAVPAPDGGDLLVGDPTPLLAGECSFRVERVGTGASQVQLQVGDESTFGHYRDVEEVTDRPGLGDEAYGFHGVAGPELHVRQGETWLGVRFGSYDDRFGLTDESHEQIATLVLDRLSGG